MFSANFNTVSTSKICLNALTSNKFLSEFSTKKA